MTTTSPTELELLKKRADTMHIPYPANIGVTALKSKVNAALNDQPIPEDEPTDEVEVRGPEQAVDTSKYMPVETGSELRMRLRREATRLVRVNVTNRNPAMKDYKGDHYTVSNSIVGDIKKYVQYDTQEGYHVPWIIVEHLKEKEYQVFIEGTDNKGRPTVTTKNVKELSVEILPPLTADEMEELKIKQALNKSID